MRDFFIKLLKLPMAFFDTKLMGDLMQRMGDHGRVNSFLTQQTLNIVFSFFTFIVFSIVLFAYNWLVFTIFILGSFVYGGWLNSPVEQLMGFFYSIQDMKISLERINEIHRMEDENGKQGIETKVKEEDRGIDLFDIGFRYAPHALKSIIDGMSIHIPKGKVTAIVGASGSGKTTLIKLLLDYYPTLTGEIRIGGMDINTLNKKWWCRQCGVVMQDGVVFSESIARNIAVDDGNIDEQRLIKAARIAKK